jgi:nucleotide-binding universal stress UspA family protein
MKHLISDVLYATDLGARGPEVFSWAASLADSYGARIHILHVIEPSRMLRDPLVQRYMSPEMMQSLKERGHDEVRAELERRLEHFGRTALTAEGTVRAQVASIQVLEGSPDRVILKEADRIGADCIVLGSHNYSALGEIVIGSVARKVTMKSRRPVFLVPT